MQRIRTPLFTLRSHNLLNNAVKNAGRMKDGDDDVLNSIVMSCASAEAFIGELDYWSAINGQHNRLDPRGRLVRIQEKNHERFQRVLSAVMPSFDPLNSPFAYLNAEHKGLSYLRNRIVHQNYIDEFADAGSNEHYDRLLAAGFVYDEAQSPTQLVLPPDVLELHRLGLLQAVSKDSWNSWYELIKTQKLAWWVCRSTRDAIVKVLADVPFKLSEGFAAWRKLATAELPPLSLEQRLEEDEELKILESAYGNVVPSIAYKVLPHQEIVFTSAKPAEAKKGSTENHLGEIIDVITRREGIVPDEYVFMDLHTHFGYSHYQSGEYMLCKVEPGGGNPGRRWIEMAQAQILDGELHVFGDQADQGRQIAKLFEAFVGKPAPF